MTIQTEAARMMRVSRGAEYWRDVANHPLGEVIPGLVAITASQWKFWMQRPLIVQADLAMGSNAIVAAKGETAEKEKELQKLYSGDTTPLMVALEAADEIVFLDIFVGMHAGDMAIWEVVREEALELAHGSLDTIVAMQKLAIKRREYEDAKLLANIPRFLSGAVIEDKNDSNYNPGYFAPAPNKCGGGHAKSVKVGKELIVSVYNEARKEARRGRTAIKQQGLYTKTGMPNHLKIFGSMNGNTPEKFSKDLAISTLQESLRDHYKFYAETFGAVGLDFLINYFRVNNPAMIEVVQSAVETPIEVDF